MELDDYNQGKCVLVKDSKTYLNSDFPLFFFLDTDYREIMRNMLNDEFYIIQDKKYDIISEIRFNHDVVGFSASNFYEDYLIVELCYILPEYRGKGLFVDELYKLMNLTHKELLLNLPNRFTIESLINNNLAVKINDYLIKTSILLSFRHPIFDDVRLSTYFYDLRICACVDLSSCHISPLLDVDIFCFNADNGREFILDDCYFVNIDKLL